MNNDTLEAMIRAQWSRVTGEVVALAELITIANRSTGEMHTGNVYITAMETFTEEVEKNVLPGLND